MSRHFSDSWLVTPTSSLCWTLWEHNNCSLLLTKLLWCVTEFISPYCKWGTWTLLTQRHRQVGKKNNPQNYRTTQFCLKTKNPPRHPVHVTFESVLNSFKQRVSWTAEFQVDACHSMTSYSCWTEVCCCCIIVSGQQRAFLPPLQGNTATYGNSSEYRPVAAVSSVDTLIGFVPCAAISICLQLLLKNAPWVAFYIFLSDLISIPLSESLRDRVWGRN